jgi:hypothetical protein
MPSPYRRPLTWLFLLATASVDLAGWLGGWYENSFLSCLLMGQILVLGGWAALGRSHRLARGGGLVAGIAAFSAPDLWGAGRDQTTYEFVLTVVTTIVVTIVVCSLIWRAILRNQSGLARGLTLGFPWRFPVVELLGWMIVVAVAATLLRMTQFEVVLREVWPGYSMIVDLLIVGLASLIMAAELYDSPRTSPSTKLAALAVCLALLADLCGGLSTEYALPTTTAAAYVAAWLWVMQMDDARELRLAQEKAASASPERGD